MKVWFIADRIHDAKSLSFYYDYINNRPPTYMNDATHITSELLIKTSHSDVGISTSSIMSKKTYNCKANSMKVKPVGDSMIKRYKL